MAKKASTRSTQGAKPDCFIIMPISTPEDCYEQYKGDEDHFRHVLECLFIPAVKKAGYKPVVPESTGSEVIHAEIIAKLTNCEMVLCDMSILNANVFFELGVRTSLNKPVTYIVDDKTTKLPFDVLPIQRNEYKSALNVWEIKEEIEKVSAHIIETKEKSKNQNALWKIFKILDTAEFDPKDVTDEDRFDILYRKLDTLESKIKKKDELAFQTKSKTKSQNDFLTKLGDALGNSFHSMIDGAIEEALDELEKTRKVEYDKADTHVLTDLVFDHLRNNHPAFENAKKEIVSDRISRVLYKKLRSELNLP
ncbi:hypothetical protein [Gimesia sp.]|uniref:hypothetical protein n=1 Tax=Gimesia sp. TaxID=2024833 RepID=UPI003A9428BA